MFAGCELAKYHAASHNRRLHYWVRTEKNSTAEVDYIIVKDGIITPVEVKAGTKGGMKSMYMFLNKKGLQKGHASYHDGKWKYFSLLLPSVQSSAA